jgi:molybdenum-dependent DNA-binding transcriptional regulator ModE
VELPDPFYPPKDFLMVRKIDWESRIGRRLKLRDLHVFSTVVQRGSMAKAAQQLGVSQPAVSEVIAGLEHALGVRLLDRSAHGIEPTIYGDALLRRSVAVFDELNQGVRDIEFLSDPTIGDVGGPDTWNHALANEIFRSRWLRVPEPRIAAVSITLRARLVAAGPYLAAFLPSVLRQLYVDHYALIALPVDLPPKQYSASIATLKNRTLSPVVERFLACAREVAKSFADRPVGQPARSPKRSVSERACRAELLSVSLPTWQLPPLCVTKRIKSLIERDSEATPRGTVWNFQLRVGPWALGVKA